MLVFLQVPGFKELQAFLHCQALLQTLGGKKKHMWLRRGPEPGASCRQRQERGWGGPPEVSGHAQERASPVECVIWMEKETNQRKKTVYVRS